MPLLPSSNPWWTRPQCSAKETWKVELEASDLEDLAYQWLSEIVFLFETESAVFSTFCRQAAARTGLGSFRARLAARG